MGGFKRWWPLAIVVATIVVAVLWLRPRPHAGVGKPPPSEKGAARSSPSRGATPTRPGTWPAYLSQPGLPERRLAGRVVDEDGKAIAGADVRLRGGMFNGDTIADATATTGADGGFDFGERPVAQYTLAAVATGKEVAIESVNLGDPKLTPPPDRLELVLRGCRGTVFGTVRDSGGGEIAGASLRIGSMIGVTTGADGGYELCTGPVARQVRVEAAGYGAISVSLSSRSRIRRDLVLLPEAALEGTVVREGDQTPVPGARVVAMPMGPGQDRPAVAVVLSDDEGRFRLGGVAAGEYSFWAAAPGLGLVGVVQARALAGETTEGIVVPLVPTVAVRGIVRQGDQAIAGAVVHLKEQGGRWSTAVTTQTDGRFTAPNVFVGRMIPLVIDHDVVSPEAVEVGPQGVDGLELKVAVLGSLSGRVLRHGKPVADASVAVGFKSAVSKADGSYRVAGLDPGAIRVEVSASGAGAFGHAATSVAAGEQKTGFDIELPFGAEIAGTLVDEGGEPLAGASVQVTQSKNGDQGFSVTDEQGRFRCRSLSGGGDYRAVVYPGRGGGEPLPLLDDRPIPVADGNTLVEGVRLRVRRQVGEIAGVVVDGDGTARPDVKVVAVGDKAWDQPWNPLPSAHTDGEGRFVLRDLAEGKYLVRAEAPGVTPGMARDVATGRRDIRLVLAEAGRVRGKLVGFPPGTSVTIATLDGDRGMNASVSGLAFQRDGVAAGRYMVSATADAGGDMEAIEVIEGKTTEVVLEHLGTGSVEGTVTDLATGAPIGGMRCGAWMRQGDTMAGFGNRTVVSDERGRFSLPRVPAGTPFVYCSASSTYSAATTILSSLRAGERGTTVQIRAVKRDTDAGYANYELDFTQVAEGVRIQEVKPGSTVARGGLEVGDVVTTIDGLSLVDAGEHAAWCLLTDRNLAKPAVLQVRRGEQRLTLSILPEPR